MIPFLSIFDFYEVVDFTPPHGLLESVPFAVSRNESHTSFLDEAHEKGLKVVPGMSDFPYTQMLPGSCIETDYDCFNQSRDSYTLNLQTGFLTEFQEYHPALSYFILINEPDLKMPSTTTTEQGQPQRMAKAVVSAFDGLLEAEKLANVTGDLVPT